VFLGTHAPRLDEKGRLFLPAKYRDELAEGVVITKGQERCLYVRGAPHRAGDREVGPGLQPRLLRQRLR
jgi:DNA-binding transcriptional regulator/RsmH inhibitor MraZ